MNNTSILIGVLGALVALFFHSKLKSSKALVDNQEATKQLNTVDTSLAKNEGLLQAEEQTRKTTEVPDVSTQDLVDFVNNHKPPT